MTDSPVRSPFDRFRDDERAIEGLPIRQVIALVVGSLSVINIYVGDRRGNLHAFDTSTGERRWKYQAGNAIYSSPLVTDDTIFFGSNDGHIYAIER